MQAWLDPAAELDAISQLDLSVLQTSSQAKILRLGPSNIVLNTACNVVPPSSAAIWSCPGALVVYATNPTKANQLRQVSGKDSYF